MNFKEVLKNNLDLIVVFVAMLFFGLIFIFVTPAGVNHDEPAHLVRVDSVSRLDLIPEPNYNNIEKGVRWTNYVSRVSPDLLEYVVENRDKNFNKKTEFSDKADNKYGVETVNADAWGAAGYNFIAYVPNAIGLKLARLLDTSVDWALKISKISSLIFCSFIIAFAFGVLRKWRSKYVIFGVSLFLPILYSFTAIGPDGFLIALSILLSAIILRSFLDKKQIPRWLKAVAFVVAILIPLFKLPYITLSFCLFATPVFKFKTKNTVKRIGLLLPIIFIPFIWNLFMAPMHELQGARVYCCGGGVDDYAKPKEQINHIKHNPVDFMKAIGKFALKFSIFEDLGQINHQKTPNSSLNRDLLMLYGVILLILIIYASSDVKDRKKNSMFICWALFCLVVGYFIIATSLYVAANTVGQDIIWGVQSRYFIPVIPLIVVVLILTNDWIKIKKYVNVKKIFGVLCLINIVAVASYYLAINGT